MLSGLNLSTIIVLDNNSPALANYRCVVSALRVQGILYHVLKILSGSGSGLNI